MLNLNEWQKEEKAQLQYNFNFMPDGQPHIQMLDYGYNEPLSVLASITSMNDFGRLAVTTDAIKYSGWVPDVLVIPYFLGARQDRRIFGEALTVKVMANLINSLGYRKVSVLHPHSDSVVNCLTNGSETDHTDLVEDAIEDFKPDFLIIPDAGAAKNAKRYDKFGLPQIQCMKQRDVKTGKLSGFRVVDSVPGGRGLIVDDICDGAGTFLGLSELFGDRPLGLYTTHGLYSKGFKELNKVFEKLYCTDSYHYNGFPIEIQDQAYKCEVYKV